MKSLSDHPFVRLVPFDPMVFFGMDTTLEACQPLVALIDDLGWILYPLYLSSWAYSGHPKVGQTEFLFESIFGLDKI